jgi:hypothetical protein
VSPTAQSGESTTGNVTRVEGVRLEAAGASIETYRRELAARGVSVLAGFVAADVIDAMVVECDALAVEAYHQDVQGTPYLELPDADAWPQGHPRVTWARSSVHTVAYDQFPATSAVRALYEWEPLLAFVGRILGREPLHRYADPLGALNLAVMTDGDVLGWHYDQTDFVVSLAIQSSEHGGEFENVALLRGPDFRDIDSDERYDDVAAILRGDDTDRIVIEPMTPGTLMLFQGRRSLHGVSPITGTRPRYVALFGYDTKPDTMSSELLKLVRYGRAG